MEADAYTTYPALVAASNVKDLGLKFYGHYSMCLYFECVAQPWSQACERAAVHADPGAFGYWPLINREKNYYLQLVVSRHVALPQWALKLFHIHKSDVAALPAECVAPLRFSLTAPVEKALGLPGTPMPPPDLPLNLSVICAIAAHYHPLEAEVPAEAAVPVGEAEGEAALLGRLRSMF